MIPTRPLSSKSLIILVHGQGRRLENEICFRFKCLCALFSFAWSLTFFSLLELSKALSLPTLHFYAFYENKLLIM